MKQSKILTTAIVTLLILVSVALVPPKALAGDAPSFSVSSSLSECYEGETTIITIDIFNDTGVDILPTKYYLDGVYYTTTSMFLLPGQSHSITKNHVVRFNGAQSVSYDIHIVFNEDGDYDAYSAWETATIKQKIIGGIITANPTPAMAIITPAPATGDMSLITAAPTPDMGNISVITPAPTNMPLSTPEPTQMITPQPTSPPSMALQANDQDENVVVVSSIDPTEPPNEEPAIQSNDSVESPNESTTKLSGNSRENKVTLVLNTLSGIGVFRLLCIGLIVLLGIGYIALSIKIKKFKSNQ